jgi:hypothetical protein
LGQPTESEQQPPQQHVESLLLLLLLLAVEPLLMAGRRPLMLMMVESLTWTMDPPDQCWRTFTLGSDKSSGSITCCWMPPHSP